MLVDPSPPSLTGGGHRHWGPGELARVEGLVPAVEPRRRRPRRPGQGLDQIGWPYWAPLSISRTQEAERFITLARARWDMTRKLDKNLVPARLRAMAESDPDLLEFGAAVHRYRLNPPLSASELDAFEQQHGLALPEDYRHFLTEIGNGGAGPFYGVFPFGMQDSMRDLCRWEDGGLVGDLSRPFPHRTEWNLPSAFWDERPDPGPDVSDEEEDRLMEEWDARLDREYWSPSLTDGAIPVCHRGCALRVWLVILGPERGHVWADDRVDEGGLYPIPGSSGDRATFSDWYLAWLKESPTSP